MTEKVGQLERLIVDWWTELSRRASAGAPIAGDVALIDDVLQRESNRVEAGQLTDNEAKDFRRAKVHHELKKGAIEGNSVALDRWYQFWGERSVATEKFSTQIAHEGMKYILALHGGTALACVNAIVAQPSAPFRRALAFGAIAAIVGIFLLGVGQFLLVKTLGRHSSKIAGSISYRRGWRHIEGLARWVDTKIDKRIRCAERFVYSSMIWFGLYTIILVILIVS